jgi:hypothetical protein
LMPFRRRYARSRHSSPIAFFTLIEPFHFHARAGCRRQFSSISRR